MQPTKSSQAMRLWTVAEYHKMAEVGILQPDEPVELIAGQIIKKMSSPGTIHAVSITLIHKLFSNLLSNQVLIRTQLPITLNNNSEPEPDVALVMPDELRYLDHHPTPTEVYLIIEVADTTLKRDREIKAREYAASGIADYWILDINNRQLIVFRQPSLNGYLSEVILPENETISPLTFPNVKLNVAEMLRPRN